MSGANASYGLAVIDALLATPVQVGAAGERIVRTVDIYNGNTAAAFVECFDTATAPTLPGTPKLVFGVGANSGRNIQLDAGFLNGVYVAAVTQAGGTVAPSIGVTCNVVFD